MIEFLSGMHIVFGNHETPTHQRVLAAKAQILAFGKDIQSGLDHPSIILRASKRGPRYGEKSS